MGLFCSTSRSITGAKGAGARPSFTFAVMGSEKGKCNMTQENYCCDINQPESYPIIRSVNHSISP